MSIFDQKVELVALLSRNPRWFDILEEALEVQKKGEEKYKDKEYPYLGFEWFEVHGEPYNLRRMVMGKVLDITSSSRSSTYYKIRNPGLVRDVMKVMKSAEREEATKEKEIPRDLFFSIVGHERIKWAFKASLASKQPTHILLVGPVATAKTLFLSELSRLPDSRYILGSASSKAGIVDYLLEYKPRYLIMDEIEKSNREDLTSLLSLMQTGIVTRMKKRMRERMTLKTWVFGGANSLTRLPQEIKSRFLIIHLREYSDQEFREISLELLRREEIKNSFKEYVIEKILSYSKDVRDVLKIGRLAKTREEVDRLISMVYQKK